VTLEDAQGERLGASTQAAFGRDAARYFYKAGDEIRGPVALSAIQELVTSGQLDPMTRMRADGVHAWEPVQVYGVELPPEGPAPAPIAAAEPTPAAPPPAAGSSMGSMLWPIVIAVAVGVWWFWPTGFSDADIDRVKSTIRSEYARKPEVQDVGDVTMLRKERRELVGYVRVTFKGAPSAQTIDCGATMADDGKNFFWRCGR
jgi:hypothetical protein